MSKLDDNTQKNRLEDRGGEEPKTDTFERVSSIVGRINMKGNQLKGDEKIKEDLGADSLDQVELLMAIEDEFEVEITDEEGEKLTTVNKYVEYLEAHKPAKRKKGK